MLQTAGAWVGPSQSAISRSQEGGDETIARSGASLRFHRSGLSMIAIVRRDPSPGVALASSAHRVTSWSELQILGGPSGRVCGSHFAQSHAASRPLSATTTRSTSAGPCAVTTSTMTLRASARRKWSDPVIARAASVPRSKFRFDPSATRMPIGVVRKPGWSGRHSQRVVARLRASRMASITGWRCRADPRRGGRLNAIVPSRSGGECGRGGPVSAGALS